VIESNLFKLLCIEVIFNYDIIFFSLLIIGIIVFLLSICDMFEDFKSDWEVFLMFWPKQQYLTYLNARNRVEMLIAINVWAWF